MKQLTIFNTPDSTEFSKPISIKKRDVQGHLFISETQSFMIVNRSKKIEISKAVHLSNLNQVEVVDVKY